ncbi:MAG: glutamyl-tRNA reductase [Acidobacteriia bacterium]|nr:glutamyl-tRNA reductase [Terriglobia bacterium]
MSLLIVGLSHKTAPIDIREKLYFPETRLPDALENLISQSAISESLIISTCNRTEVLAHSPDINLGIHLVTDFLSDFHGQPKEVIQNFLYDFSHTDAVRHVFRVASSLDSMVLGEPQILGQVKNAFTLANRLGAVGENLSPLMNKAFHVAKRIRSETGISNSAVSISYAAVELSKKIFDTLNGRTVLLLGAGKMSELSAKHLTSQGVSKLLIWNRTYQRAVDLAKTLQGEAIPPEELFRHVERADILICSTGAPGVVLRKTDGQRIIKLRKNRPVFIIDIAMPRDVDPEINKIDNIFLYDIDDLRHVVDANLKHRLKEAQFAEGIINEEVQSYVNQVHSLDITPTIVALKKHWDLIRQEELEKTKKQLGELSTEQEVALENMTQSIIKKFLHGPISEIKSVHQTSSGSKHIEMIKKMLGLKE